MHPPSSTPIGRDYRAVFQARYPSCNNTRQLNPDQQNLRQHTSLRPSSTIPKHATPQHLSLLICVDIHYGCGRHPDPCWGGGGIEVVVAKCQVADPLFPGWAFRLVLTDTDHSSSCVGLCWGGLFLFFLLRLLLLLSLLLILLLVYLFSFLFLFFLCCGLRMSLGFRLGFG